MSTAQTMTMKEEMARHLADTLGAPWRFTGTNSFGMVDGQDMVMCRVQTSSTRFEVSITLQRGKEMVSTRVSEYKRFPNEYEAVRVKLPVAVAAALPMLREQMNEKCERQKARDEESRTIQQKRTALNSALLVESKHHISKVKPSPTRPGEFYVQVGRFKVTIAPDVNNGSFIVELVTNGTVDDVVAMLNAIK